MSPISETGTTSSLLIKPETWVSSLIQTLFHHLTLPNPILQQILLILPQKYILYPSTSLHLHYNHSLSIGPQSKASKLLSPFPIWLFSNANTIQYDQSFKKNMYHVPLLLLWFPTELKIKSRLLTLAYKSHLSH